MSPFAQRLADAHRSGAIVPFDGAPADAAGAMECQRAVADALGAAVAGWKVAQTPDGGVAAPLFSHRVKTAPADWRFAPGLALELEIAVILKRDPPAGTRDRAALIGCVDAIAVGVELVRPRVAAGAPPTALLADNLGNDGYLIAAERFPYAELSINERRCRVALAGETLYDAPCIHPQGDPLAPLLAYASAPNDRFGGLKAGQIVTTASLCGLIQIPGPGEVVCAIENLGAIAFAIV